MKKNSILSIILFFLGLSIAIVAIFANSLGLDKNPGWSKSRFELLFFGILIVLCSVLYYRYLDEIHAFARKIQSKIESVPVQYLTFPIVLIVLIIYVWFGSSGRWSIWKSHTHYYDSLAKGFLNANLHLPIEPDPQLLALPNPYDPVARKGIDVPVDLTLYKGKFYMYWGPAPALILTAIYAFSPDKIGDLSLTFIFVCGIFILQVWLLLTVWKHYFRNLPAWLFHISIPVMGLAGPLMLLRHNYESAVIYEAAITGGQLFLMAGALMAFFAMISSTFTGWKLASAGIFWALAIGSRQILAVPIGFMTLLLIYWAFKTNLWSFKKSALTLIPLGLPLMLGFVCLGWYNWARFGSVTETGLYYQLAGWNIRDHYDELFSPTYIFQNIQNYLFNPIEFTSTFPFVFMTRGSEIPVLPFYTVPEIYNAQPVSGLLCTFPFAVFAIVPFLIQGFKKKLNQNSVESNNPMPLHLLTLGLGGSSVIALVLLMMFFWVGMRYLGDVTPSLMTLSVIGFWQGYQALTHRSLMKRIYTNGGVVLAGMSILLSTLLALSTNDGLIKFILRQFPLP